MASNAALENPTIAPLINLMDAAQRAGQIRTFDMSKYLMAMQGKAEWKHRPPVCPDQSGNRSGRGEIFTSGRRNLRIAMRMLRRDAIMTSSWNCSESSRETESARLYHSRIWTPSRNCETRRENLLKNKIF